ncbi:MAG: sugar metabolism transcriptional regulator [Kamptonema sp. SIO4C4]|nr:sugar metabolism transcriptional regulator [Kamptonema sp. SIO4C4]
MILTNLQNYIATHQKVSLEDLSNHFHSAPEALRPMLNRLMRKGRIYKHKSKKCHGCAHCTPESIEFYEWIHERNTRDSLEYRTEAREPRNVTCRKHSKPQKVVNR